MKSLRLEDALKELLVKEDFTAIVKGDINWVEVNNTAADLLVSKIREIHPGVGYLHSLYGQHVNYTALFERAYTRYKVVIIKDVDVSRLRFSFKIGHSLPDLDLTQVFRLRGGNPRRVTVYGKSLTIQAILARIKPYLESAVSAGAVGISNIQKEVIT